MQNELCKMLKKVREHVARMWSGVALDIVGNEAM